MAYGGVQILEVEPFSTRSHATPAREDSLRNAAFECRWPGDPAKLREAILMRVDWGPFEISCREYPRQEDGCLCTVHYSGPLRERPHLMASFWHVMEQLSFYRGRVRTSESPDA